MVTDDHGPHAPLADWSAVLGDAATVGQPYRERELWPVSATDGTEYFLKRLGPWRNLPVADEAAVLEHLTADGVPVARWLPTDDGAVTSGAVEDSFVLMPRLEAAEIDTDDVVRSESVAGAAVARLHRVLDAYPRSTNSYTERIGEGLQSDLDLPDDLRAGVEPRRTRIAADLESLPKQLVHGDLTPDNVLRRTDGSVSAFIDFDHLPQAPRIWDLAKYLSRRVRLRWRRGASSPDRTACWSPFLDGYERITPLRPEERRMLPDAVLAYNVLEVDFGRAVASGRLPRRMLSDHHEALADAEDAVRWQLDAM